MSDKKIKKLRADVAAVSSETGIQHPMAFWIKASDDIDVSPAPLHEIGIQIEAVFEKGTPGPDAPLIYKLIREIHKLRVDAYLKSKKHGPKKLDYETFEAIKAAALYLDSALVHGPMPGTPWQDGAEKMVVKLREIAGMEKKNGRRS